MRISRCVNCMEKIEAYPCPYCGCEADQSGNKDYALPCGTILQGRYLVGRVLGRGGFGITYIGLDLALETKVAIKEFYPNGQVTRNLTMGLDLLWNEDEQTPQMRSSGMETFLREARKMAKVDRIPEVVRVRDTFLSNETAYIIMDFVDGETLKSRLERKGVLSWEEAERIFFPAISAMEKVHQAGLIHRDLSPDNLMLQPDGSVSILDLGAAKDLKASSGVSSMQVAKSGFSPIEQYTQRGGSGPWTDVYSMAATMYYALTGVLPPTAVDRVEEDTLRWDLPSLNALPENIRTALRNAMQVFAKSRTQSMQQLLEQMQAASAKKLKHSKTGKQQKLPKEKVKKEKNDRQKPVKEKPVKERKRHRIPAWSWVVGIGAVTFLVIFFNFDGHLHQWMPATCEAPPTCSICGQTTGYPLEHTLSRATCEEAPVCSACGQTVGEPMGHQWQEATCQTPKTCTVCGMTEGVQRAHSWKAATCEAPMTCEVCGTKSDELKEHTWPVIGPWSTSNLECQDCGALMPIAEGARELNATWEGTLDISDLTCTYNDGDDWGMSRWWETPVEGTVDVRFTINDPSEVVDLQRYTFAPFKMNDMAIKYCIDEYMKDSKEETVLTVRKMPFVHQSLYPVFPDYFGNTLCALILGLDKDGNIVGHVVVSVEIPKS